VVPVEVVAAVSQEVTERVVVSGSLTPLRHVDLSAQTSGTVQVVKVQLGDRVRKGQLLARLDARLARAQVQQAEANLRSAKARALAAGSQAARTERLAKEGASSGSQLDSAVVENESAIAGVEAAAASLAIAKSNLSKTRITAPWTGTLAAVHLEVGGSVAPGQPAFRLVDVDRLRVSAGVSSKVVQQLRLGQTARVYLTDGGVVGSAGAVARIGPEADPRARTYPVEIEVPNENNRLRAGMVARVEIEVGSRPNAIVIPELALVDGATPHVFVVNETTARKRNVVPGERNGDDLEIREGLQIGERVVTLGRQHLSDTTQVQVYTLGETPKPESAGN
jgi:RND family efflux transporter MFP subunit